MNTQFAIPGLMTAPTTPKSENRIVAAPDGTVRATLHQSTRGGDPVDVQVVRLKPGGRYERLVYDKGGITLFRERTGAAGPIEAWNYIWYYDALSTPLPAGDLQLWVDAPKKPRKVYSLYVKDIVVDLPVAASSATEEIILTTESLWGNQDLPIGVSAMFIPFNFEFHQVPNTVLVSVMAPLGLETIEVVTANVAGYDSSGVTVALSSPVSIAGYKIAWAAASAPTEAQTPSHQRGQFLVPAGVSGVVIPLRTAAPSIPNVIGSVQSTAQDQQIEVIGYVIYNVTLTQFTVMFSSPQTRAFLFNWESHT
jgi:hypothetical protein